MREYVTCEARILERNQLHRPADAEFQKLRPFLLGLEPELAKGWSRSQSLRKVRTVARIFFLI